MVLTNLFQSPLFQTLRKCGDPHDPNDPSPLCLRSKRAVNTVSHIPASTLQQKIPLPIPTPVCWYLQTCFQSPLSRTLRKCGDPHDPNDPSPPCLCSKRAVNTISHIPASTVQQKIPLPIPTPLCWFLQTCFQSPLSRTLRKCGDPHDPNDPRLCLCSIPTSLDLFRSAMNTISHNYAGLNRSPSPYPYSSLLLLTNLFSVPALSDP